MASGSPNSTSEQSSSEAQDQASGSRPKIKSLLDIDPWLDVPGMDSLEPPSKVARIVEPEEEPKTSDSGENKESTSQETEDDSPATEAKPVIRSLLDLNPFEVPGAPNRPQVMPAMAPVSGCCKEDSNKQKLDGVTGENADTAESGSRIPSLLEIDPFQGMPGPMGAGIWANQQRGYGCNNQGSPHFPLMAQFPLRDAGLQRKSGRKQGKTNEKMDGGDTDEETKDEAKKLSEELAAKLLKAIESNNVEEMSEVLKTPGIDLGEVGSDGYTALTCAAKQVNLDSVMMLVVREGIDVNGRDGHGETALHVLAKVTAEKVPEALTIVKELLGIEGLNVGIEDREGRTPLMLACASGNVDMVKVLIERSDVDAASHDGSTALHVATKKRHAGVVELLLEAGANPDVRDSAYETPLITAARGGDLAIVKALIDAKCDLNWKGFMEYTALHWAVHGGYEEVTMLLVEKGADLTAQSALIRTPLHRAVTAGHTNIVQFLLQAGSQTELTDANGETPLLTATRYGFDEIVRALLLCNANPDPFGRRGRSPLIRAITSGYSTIADLLVKADCDLSLLQLTSIKAGGSRFQWLELQDSVQSFITKYYDHISKPRPLKRLCRTVIRRQLGSGWSVMKKLDALPVPETLHEFLKLKQELSEDSSNPSSGNGNCTS